MKLHEPIAGYINEYYPTGSVTQWFGENVDIYRPWGLEGHNGIDIVAPHGTPLLAVEDCYVVQVELSEEGFGKHIRLRSKNTYQGKYREWTYGHCSKIHVVAGKEVEAGQTIGLMGNTGFVVSGPTPWWEYNPFAGTHLHLGMRYLIPDDTGWKYSGDTITYNVENYNNGFKGAVNFKYLLSDDIDSVPAENVQMYQQLLTIQSIINMIKSTLGK